MFILKALVFIITLPLRAVGLVLAGLLKLLGCFVGVVSGAIGALTAFMGGVGIVGCLIVMCMHLYGQIDFPNFWFCMGGGMFCCFLLVMVGAAGEAIGDWLGDIGGSVFELAIIAI